MSVIVEFSIDSDDFPLGRAFSGPDGLQFELERVVPTGDGLMPYVWVSDESEANFEAFERTARESPHVEALTPLDSVDGRTLYRFEWDGIDERTIVEAIDETDGTVLEAQGNDQWWFRLRFPDHDRLSEFYEFCTDHEIPLHIERTYTTTDESERVHQFGLSEEQREALVLALKRGYFATPSEVSLDTLADELGITQQALSNRIRRGNEQVLRRALHFSESDFE